MLEGGLQQYLIEASRHCRNYKAELDELRNDLLADNFKSRDYRACERLLQVYVELCIGLAKHWSKRINKAAGDAYQAFTFLAEANQLNPRAC